MDVLAMFGVEMKDGTVIFDTEGVLVPEVLKKKVLVVDSLAASGTGLAEAVKQVAAEGKVVVVDSCSDMPPVPKASELVPEKEGRRPLWSRGERSRSEEMMAMAFLAAAGGMGWGMAPMRAWSATSYGSSEPKLAKCGLPSCKTMTTHNGGYCCAEHCKEHRRIQREARK